MLAGTILLPFANSKAHYWTFAFPGFFIGTAGMTIVFATTKYADASIPLNLCRSILKSDLYPCFSIALFDITPPEIAGTVGAIFTCALQLGSAAGAAIVISIQTSVQKTHGGPNEFQGRAAGLWFLFAFTAVETLGVLIFMKNTVPPRKQTKQDEVPGSEEERG